MLARIGRPQDKEALDRAIAYLRGQQEADGSWFGRWGTNYIYGTWSVMMAFAQARIGADDPAVRRAVDWLKLRQNSDGGWGESNDTYAMPAQKTASTAYQSAWALLALLAAGAGPLGRGAARRRVLDSARGKPMACGATLALRHPDFPGCSICDITAIQRTSRSGRWLLTAR